MIKEEEILTMSDGKDYYVFDQVAQALGGPLGQSLVERILSVPLPYRG